MLVIISKDDICGTRYLADAGYTKPEYYFTTSFAKARIFSSMEEVTTASDVVKSKPFWKTLGIVEIAEVKFENVQTIK